MDPFLDAGGFDCIALRWTIPKLTRDPIRVIGVAYNDQIRSGTDCCRWPAGELVCVCFAIPNLPLLEMFGSWACCRQPSHLNNARAYVYVCGRPRACARTGASLSLSMCVCLRMFVTRGRRFYRVGLKPLHATGLLACLQSRRGG